MRFPLNFPFGSKSAVQILERLIEIMVYSLYNCIREKRNSLLYFYFHTGIKFTLRK